jgi:hypothetical protein
MIGFDSHKIEQAAKLLEEAGMPYLAAMARRGGTAADMQLAGLLVECPDCEGLHPALDQHTCPDGPLEETYHG